MTQALPSERRRPVPRRRSLAQETDVEHCQNRSEAGHLAEVRVARGFSAQYDNPGDDFALVARAQCHQCSYYVDMALSRRTAVVVPCYNEARRLKCEAFEAALAKDEHLEFIFVNDGSRDETGEILAALRQRAGERVHVFNLEHNSGKAEAVRRGVLKAFELDASYIGYWDADLATPLDCIESFARELDVRDVSLILGSRVLLVGRNIVRSPLRHYVGRVFATLAVYSLGFPVYDTQCGAKLFRATDVFRDVFSRPFDLNWTFDVEILKRLNDLRNSNYRFDIERECIEYPLPEWIDAPGSKLTLAQYPKILGELARLTIQRLFFHR